MSLGASETYSEYTESVVVVCMQGIQMHTIDGQMFQFVSQSLIITHSPIFEIAALYKLLSKC